MAKCLCAGLLSGVTLHSHFHFPSHHVVDIHIVPSQHTKAFLMIRLITSLLRVSGTYVYIRSTACYWEPADSIKSSFSFPPSPWPLRHGSVSCSFPLLVLHHYHSPILFCMIPPSFWATQQEKRDDGDVGYHPRHLRSHLHPETLSYHGLQEHVSVRAAYEPWFHPLSSLLPTTVMERFHGPTARES